MTNTPDSLRPLWPRPDDRKWSDEDRPRDGVASDALVEAWRRDVHEIPDALLDEELVKLLDLIHHKT